MAGELGDQAGGVELASECAHERQLPHLLIRMSRLFPRSVATNLYRVGAVWAFPTNGSARQKTGVL